MGEQTFVNTHTLESTLPLVRQQAELQRKAVLRELVPTKVYCFWCCYMDPTFFSPMKYKIER